MVPKMNLYILDFSDVVNSDDTEVQEQKEYIEDRSADM